MLSKATACVIKRQTKACLQASSATARFSYNPLSCNSQICHVHILKATVTTHPPTHTQTYSYLQYDYDNNPIEF